MKHEFQIDPENHLLSEKFVGELTLKELDEANSKILNHKDFCEGLKCLSDLREAIVPWGFESMLSHVQALPDLKFSRQAFIVGEMVEFGMVRMFIALCENRQNQTKSNIFPSVEKGMEWLIS